jgi:membrane protease YdiL (CAAX protease family)
VAAALTGVWIGLGLLLRPDPRLYLVLGVPLIAGFQVLVRRRPIRKLWVRDAESFRMDGRAWTYAALLAAYPALAFLVTAATADWLDALMAAACFAGAVAGGFAFRRLGRPSGPAVRAFALATAIGVGWMIYALVPPILQDPDAAAPLAMAGRALHSALLYLPVAFVLEEVSFRGAVDAHVHHPGESRGWLSAVYVSALWAVWHVPMDLGSEPVPDLVLSLLIVHVTIGVPLSFAWRRSGNLALPAVAHAAIDGVRDGLSLR